MERRTRAQGDVFQKRYRIVGLLGRGGFGTTYEAIDGHTGARVVLKEMALRDAGDWKSVERFEREARVLDSLHHPNIPRYVDHGTFSGDQPGLFLVCELADGPSLAQKVLTGWRPSEAEIVALARHVLDVLVYLHGRSPPIVHRDIKPANLILRDDGAVALVDFGAVRDGWPGGASRASTIVVGTFGYIAPEQYRGEASARSDLFALGCTLVFAMTGLTPTELPQRRLRLLFRSSARVSRGLGSWLDRMMAPATEDRFASAYDALRALDRLQTWRGGWESVARATALLGLVVAAVGSSLTEPLAERGAGLGGTASPVASIQVAPVFPGPPTALPLLPPPPAAPPPPVSPPGPTQPSSTRRDVDPSHRSDVTPSRGSGLNGGGPPAEATALLCAVAPWMQGRVQFTPPAGGENRDLDLPPGRYLLRYMGGAMTHDPRDGYEVTAHYVARNLECGHHLDNGLDALGATRLWLDDMGSSGRAETVAGVEERNRGHTWEFDHSGGPLYIRYVDDYFGDNLGPGSRLCVFPNTGSRFAR